MQSHLSFELSAIRLNPILDQVPRDRQLRPWWVVPFCNPCTAQPFARRAASIRERRIQQDIQGHETSGSYFSFCVCVCVLLFFFFLCLPVCFFFFWTAHSEDWLLCCSDWWVCEWVCLCFFFFVSLLVFVVVAFAGLDFLPRTKDLPPGCMSSVSVLCVCVCVFWRFVCAFLFGFVCVSVFLFVCLCLLVVGLVCLCLSGSSCLLVLAAFTKDLPLADS